MRAAVVPVELGRPSQFSTGAIFPKRSRWAEHTFSWQGSQVTVSGADEGFSSVLPHWAGDPLGADDSQRPGWKHRITLSARFPNCLVCRHPGERTELRPEGPSHCCDSPISGQHSLWAVSISRGGETLRSCSAEQTVHFLNIKAI